jgi:hypothetical protein
MWCLLSAVLMFACVDTAAIRIIVEMRSRDTVQLQGAGLVLSLIIGGLTLNSASEFELTLCLIVIFIIFLRLTHLIFVEPWIQDLEFEDDRLPER